MRKLHIAILMFFVASVTAQNVDVTSFSQNIVLADSQATPKAVVRQLASYPSGMNWNVYIPISVCTHMPIHMTMNLDYSSTAIHLAIFSHCFFKLNNM